MALLPEGNDAFSVEMVGARPAELLFKIESFSKLSIYHKSMAFASGNFKWILGINLCDSKDERINIDLSLAELNTLPKGWEIKGSCSIFLRNHILGNYLCFRGKEQRFNAENSRWGFSISKKMLTEPSNGFIYGDSCTFGAEVLFSKEESLQYLSVLTWEIPPSSRPGGVWTSEVIVVGDIKWKIKISGGERVVMYLECVSSLSKEEEVGADICIHMKRKMFNNADNSTTASHCFTSNNAVCEISCPKGFTEYFENVFVSCLVEIEMNVKK